MYELFVLGELMTGNKHGYMLREILNTAAGPFGRFSSGTLYPLLSRLEGAGLIRLRHEDESENGRQRKKYELTEAGRRRFHELMQEPLTYNAETEQLVHFKMVYFPYVGKEVRIACLEQYLHYLKTIWNYVAAMDAQLRLAKPEPEEQRLQLLRIFDHRKTVGAADIAWVEQEIRRIREEE